MPSPAANETLLGYVPMVVARHLAAEPRSAASSWAESFPAAVLFADIVGFTPLTRRLEQRGQQGVEELSQIMNEYWDPLIELVSSYGGDVVKFLGDALLAIWPAVGEDLRVVTQRAAQCSLAVAARFSSFEVGDGLRLSTKATVVCGDVVAAAVAGLDGRRRFVLAGLPLSQLEAAAGNSNPGYVALSPQAWSLVEGIGEGLPLADGHVALMNLRMPTQVPAIASQTAVGLVDERVLRPYVPETVLSRLDAGQAEWLAEFRTATVLFVNIGGVIYQSANALSDLEQVMHGLEAVIQRQEGFVKDLRIDDKGTTFVAVFGVPPKAHEDDPIRAVRAALAIRKTVGEFGLSCGVGIATGRMFCGRIGNARRTDFDINGEAMPLAARLMVAAGPNVILCDEDTYQAARTRILFEELPRFVLKGVDHPVAVYRPAVPVHTPKVVPSLVGRDLERALLRQRVEDVCAHRAGAVLIEGEPGIGKSQLVRTLATDADAVGVRCVFGASEAIERSTPFFAWRKVFSELYGLDQSADVHEVRQRVLAGAVEDPKLFRLAPLLNTVLSLDLPDNEITSQMDGQVRASNVQDLLVHALRTAAAGQPRVLVLEDCQWLDSASWSLARAVSQEAPSILLVLTARSFAESLPTDFQELAQAPTTHRLRLEPLGAEQTHALLCHMLRVPRISDDVVELVDKRAEGNPFFTQELAYALRDADLIAVVDGTCRLVADKSGAPEVDLPTTIQGVVTSRIDQLEPSVQLTLKVAAVVGVSFQYEILKAVHPVESDLLQLEDHLNALELADLIRRSTDGPDFRNYTFTHVITQEVAYELLPFAQRRHLHHALAEAYERQHAENLAPFLPLLAHNFRLAGDIVKTLEYLEKAGDQALGLFNNEEAVQFFSDAVTIGAELTQPPDLSRRAHWELQLGQALVNLSRYAEGRDHLETGLALSGRSVSATTIGQIADLLGLMSQQLLHRLWPSYFVGRSAAHRELLLPVHRAYVRLGEAYFYSHAGMLPLIASVFHVLNTAEEAGSPAELAEGYAEMGGLFGLIPLHALARSYLQRALDVADESGDSAARPIVWIAAGFYYIGVGEWHKARQLFEEMLDLSARLGDKRRWMDAISNVISVYEFQGQFALVEPLIRDYYEMAVRQHDPRNQAEALVKTASYNLQVGQFEPAIHHLDAASTLYTEHPEILDVPLQQELHGLYSIAQLRTSAAELAVAAAEQALALTSTSRPTQYFRAGYAGPAEVFVSLWESGFSRSDLSRLATRACEMLGRYSSVFKIGLPQLRLYEAHCEWLKGNEARALRGWSQSLDAAERLAMRYDQALAHYELGRHLSETDADRETHLRQASELFEACGSVYHRSRTQLAMATPALT